MSYGTILLYRPTLFLQFFFYEKRFLSYDVHMTFLSYERVSATNRLLRSTNRKYPSICYATPPQVDIGLKYILGIRVPTIFTIHNIKNRVLNLNPMIAKLMENLWSMNNSKKKYLSFGRILILHKNSRFSLICFGFSRISNDLLNAPTRFTFEPEKLLELKIEAFFRHVLVYTDKKNT
ncbi:Uncharacterized protein FWK35_00009560 [Aphis craccivora]|uniref:Uncharacterized protein n=1 Tax=Aphis craccivora TaxID=307492 RepID=A0A6G0Y2P6_APHCR|nr:Uncharacterized protein FWK35_00009560 [Aphis craccivora]